MSEIDLHPGIKGLLRPLPIPDGKKGQQILSVNASGKDVLTWTLEWSPKFKGWIYLYEVYTQRGRAIGWIPLSPANFDEGDDRLARWGAVADLLDEISNTDPGFDARAHHALEAVRLLDAIAQDHPEDAKRASYAARAIERAKASDLVRVAADYLLKIQEILD